MMKLFKRDVGLWILPFALVLFALAFILYDWLFLPQGHKEYFSWPKVSGAIVDMQQIDDVPYYCPPPFKELYAGYNKPSSSGTTPIVSRGPQEKCVWVFSNFSIVPRIIPFRQENDEILGGNIDWIWTAWFKEHPKWEEVERGAIKMQNGEWFYLKVRER